MTGLSQFSDTQSPSPPSVAWRHETPAVKKIMIFATIYTESRKYSIFEAKFHGEQRLNIKNANKTDFITFALLISVQMNISLRSVYKPVVFS